MLNIATDIQSLTTFRRRSSAMLKQMKKSRRPLILTVNGKAAAVVQDALSYRRLLDLAANADSREGIRQGVEDVRKGKTRAAQDFFRRFESERNL